MLTGLHTDWLSPSLAVVPDGTVPAHELKFILETAAAAEVEAWARLHLSPDPHGDDGRYRVTSVYYDTPEFAVGHRAPGFDEHKHRARRYGTGPTAYLERKSKRNGRVWKCRIATPHARLDAGLPDGWFAREVADLNLQPTCRVTYERTAFAGAGAARLTLDRTAFGVLSDALDLEPLDAGLPLLRAQVIAEFKFIQALPTAFKGLIADLKLVPVGVSKYRRCATAAGLLTEVVVDA